MNTVLHNWGEPERAPHSRALQDVRPSVQLVSVRCVIVMLRRPPATTRAYKSPSIMHDSTESNLLHFTPVHVLQTTYYRLVESCRGQLEGEILSATWGTPLRCSVASFPVPSPAFCCLLYVACSTASDDKARRGTPNEATTNLNYRPSMMNDNWLHRRPHPHLPL